MPNLTNLGYTEEANSSVKIQKQRNCREKAFGNKVEGFIGFGTPERESKLTLKTSPRWCQKRRLDGR